MENRQQKMAEFVSKIENNMDFLCVTGVEDLLQDDVATTIDNLRNAGMKVWMLTGDKVETATCISISAGLKAKTHKIYTIKNDDIKKLLKTKSELNKLINYKRKEEQSRLGGISKSKEIIDFDYMKLNFNNDLINAFNKMQRIYVLDDESIITIDDVKKNIKIAIFSKHYLLNFFF